MATKKYIVKLARRNMRRELIEDVDYTEQNLQWARELMMIGEISVADFRNRRNIAQGNVANMWREIAEISKRLISD